MKALRWFSFLIALLLLVSPAILRAQSSAARARVTQAVDVHNLVALPGNVHPLARQEYDQGAAPDDLPMERILLVLRRSAEQETALRRLLDDQQVRSSARFHQWLAPEQLGEQFGPADADIQAVTAWLAGQGFEVKNVSAGRTVIEFSGTAGTVRQALGTEIHKFRVHDEDRWANAEDPQIPAALAPVVAGFASLNNFPRNPTIKNAGAFRRSKATGAVEPQFTFPSECGDGGGECYYFALGPTDFATLYNVLPLWNAATPTDGAGQTIAVVGETNINPQDVADFRSMFGLPANPPNIILNGPDPGILTDGEETEADLDVQWSGGVAKGATIDFVVSESTETTAGIDLSALYIIDNNLAPVMSESYGACEAALGAGGNQFYNTLWEQAAAQGITVLLAAGDSGSAGCDSANAGETAAQYGLAVSGCASTPFDVAVGGTSFNFNANNWSAYWSTTNTPNTFSSALSYIPEATWNESCASSGLLGCTPPPNATALEYGEYLYAGSGGPSSCTSPTNSTAPLNSACSGGYAKPSWQTVKGVPNDGARDIPDVSLSAGGTTFYVVCQMDANASDSGSSSSCDLNSPYEDFQGAVGTSASVQVFAGIMAMVNQAHGRQGNANYVLYPMAAASGASCSSSTESASNSSCVFYDLTVGNNSVICQSGTPNCSNTSTLGGQYGIMAYDSPAAPAYPATNGYDLATGLGSVNVAHLVNNWKSNFTTTETTLSLATNPPTNPISLTHGQAIDFTVNVTSGSGTPTGDVSLIAQTGSSASNSTGIGPFTLSGGSASGSTLMLPGGSYNVTAHYAGNGTDGASSSSPGIAVTVAPQGSATLLTFVTFSTTTGAPSTTVTTTPYGYPYFLRMDVTNGNSSGQLCAPANSAGEQGLLSYPCPSGTVTVTPAPTDQNPPPGTVPGTYKLSSQGYAEDQPIQLSPGAYPFVANYGGDASYKGSTSATLPVTITPGITTTLLTNLPFSPVEGTSVVLTASLTTAFTTGVAPTGSLQFLCNGSPLGSVPLTGLNLNQTTSEYLGVLNLNATLPVGTDTITAQYSGDTNYSASTSSAVTLTVTSFSLSANPSSVTIAAPGQSGTTTISASPINGFAGWIYYDVSGCPMGATCTLASPSVTLSGSLSVSDVLTITTTTGSSSAMPPSSRRAPPGHPLPINSVWVLAAALVLAMLLRSPALRRRPSGWLLALILLLLGAWIACGGGGGGGNQGPPQEPAASLSPASLSFASQSVGTSSAAQTLTLNNTGNGSLSITSISMSGANPGDFSQTNTCGTSVAAGGNCAISVTFTPTGTGARSASLNVADNASGSPQSTTLAGAGATPLGTFPVSVSGQGPNGYVYLTVNVTVK